VLTQLFTAKVATFAAVALLTAGTAAAATGNLPGPLHHSVASTSSHDDLAIAESTDESTDESTTATTETPTSTTTTSTTVTDATTTTSTSAADSESDGAVGPDANGPAKHGLCIAYFAGHAKNPNAVAFRNLINAATASGATVEAFCAPTTTTTSVTTDTDVATTEDATTTDDATDTHGHGHGGSTPGDTAPGRMSHGKP
jgi:ribosomal protein S12